MTEQEAEKALDYIRTTAPLFAEAKANRTYIENFMKSKKAILMAEAAASTIGGKDMEAMAHPDYITLLEGHRDATRLEEEYKWKMEAAKLYFEKWKVEQFNQRIEARAIS